MAANDRKVLTMTYHQHKSSTMPGLSNKAAPHCAIGGPPKSLPPFSAKTRRPFLLDEALLFTTQTNRFR